MKSLFIASLLAVAVASSSAVAQEPVIASQNADQLFTSPDPQLNANKQVVYRRCHVVRLRPDEALSVKLRQLRRSRPSSAPWRGSDECGWRGRSVFDATGRNDF